LNYTRARQRVLFYHTALSVVNKKRRLLCHRLTGKPHAFSGRF